MAIFELLGPIEVATIDRLCKPGGAIWRLKPDLQDHYE